MAKDENKVDLHDDNVTPQPGTVIAPGTPAQPSVESQNETPPPAVPVAAEPVLAPARAAQATPEPDGTESSQTANAASVTNSSGDDSDTVTWTASEFIAHDKSVGWYFALAVVTLAIAALMLVVTKDKISAAVVVVAGILLGVYGAHKPRQLQYVVDRQGIGIGNKYHAYDEFRSFSVVPEGAFSSIVFFPLKRFAMLTTVYYAPEDEEKIIAVLADRLPLEEHRHDAVDSLMRRLRF